jgi:hypothetical protein
LLKKIHREICGNEKQPWWREDIKRMEPTSADEYVSAEDYDAAREAYLKRKKDTSPVEGA